MRIAVIGAGIAGLTAAHRLMEAHEVVVYERAARPGGKIHSEQRGAFLFEWGPGGFLSSADELRALVAEAGLADDLIEAAPAARNRFIFWNGSLHKLPAKPPQIFSFSLLSPAAKVRALAELVRPRRAAQARSDESVYGFMQRRFGRDVAERIVAPAVLGISGGDAKTTGIGAIFPRLPEFERTNGSVIRGMLRGGRKPAHMLTFRDGGMQRLTARLADRLGARVRTGAGAERIERGDDGSWRIVTAADAASVDGVIVTAPAHAAADLLAGVDGGLATRLREIAYAPMRVIGVAFRASDVPVALDGFGFLAARDSGVRILGATYSSTIVPEQAPEETAYVRVFMGGATDRAAALLAPDDARAIVLADLATVLGVTAEPVAYHETIWHDAIPQYDLDHLARVRAIDALVAAHPGLALAGNAYRGLGVGDTVREARVVAARFAIA